MQSPIPQGKIYAWDAASTYVKNPPYFVGMDKTPKPVGDIVQARVLALLGDSVTTDHISPAGNISKTSPAARYLGSLGVQAKDFNSYGARRGNHEIMMRGTFANIRLRNLLLPGTEGGVTLHIPSGEQMSIYDAAMRYKEAGTSLVILAGKEYGTGSSRDWAAKGTMLLGVRAVIAESFERIHRSNLIGMGVLPLQFKPGESALSLGLTGRETLRHPRDRRRRRPHGDRDGNTGFRRAHPISGACAHRYAEGARVLPSRRHPSLRAAPARGTDTRCVMQLAIFDLDGTITRHDTLVPYVFGYLRGHPWRFPRLLAVLPALLRFAMDRDRGELKSALIRRVLGNVTRSLIDEWTADSCRRCLQTVRSSKRGSASPRTAPPATDWC